MKTTRAAFLASVGAVFVTAGAALAHHREGHSGGGGGGRGRGKKKVVVNGTVVSVDSETTFVLHRSGGRGAGGNGSNVVIVTDDDTVFLRSDDTEGFFEDLAEGIKAQAKGKKNQDGSLQATRVLIKFDEDEETEE